MQLPERSRDEFHAKTKQQGTSLLQERAAQQTTAPLQESIQSRLAACHLWLSTVEKLLGDLRFDMDRAVPEMHAHSVLTALSLLNKVRSEVESLRSAEIERTMQQLYPTLIHVGLRTALEALNALPEGNVFVDAGRGQPGADVEWRFSDAFVRWDQPIDDEETLRVRLEAYRLLEAAVRSAQVGAATLLPPFPVLHSGPEPALEMRIHLDIRDGVLSIRLDARVGVPDGMRGDLLEFIAASLPRQRFEAAGGSLSVLVNVGESLHVRALLPAV